MTWRLGAGLPSGIPSGLRLIFALALAAFAGLPDRPGGYASIRFWTDLAYENKYPLAQLAHAATESAGMLRDDPSNIDASKLQSMQADINSAAATGDPEALFKVGFFLSDSRIGADSLHNFSAMIAACDLAYDCTASNESIFGHCIPYGLCQPGDIYADRIKQVLGEDGYAQAYAFAQLLEDAIARGDTSIIRQFVKLKGER
jgi:hypothetical protein